MKKAFLYDSLCGIVYRCMYAGLDEYGHAQWVNITPGEEPKTLQDYVEDEELGESRFFVLAMEGEAALPMQVARVLGKVAECPITGICADMSLAVKHMQEIGVKWDCKPLELVFRVFENGKTSKRSGKYSLWIEDKEHYCSTLADIDGFDSMEDLFRAIRNYCLVLEDVAGIPILSKDLGICDKLKKGVRKSDLSMFGRVEEEDNVLTH